MSQGPGSSWRSRVVPGASDHGGQRDHPHQQREQHLGCPGSTAVAVGVGCGICWAGYQIFSWIQFYQKYLRCQQDYKLQTTYLDNLSDTSCCSSKNVRWPVRLVVMGRYCNAPGWIRKKVALCCAPVPASNDQSILASMKLDEAGHSTGENRKQS